MSSLSTPAIVLRAINYGEADRVVTLFGRTTGRLAALARGARKSQKRFGGGLELCAVGDAGLRERMGAELLTLERFDLRQTHASFGGDLARMAHAAYVAELVSKLCAPRQADPAVYDWLESFLGRLDAEGASAQRLRVFELGLLDRLGFGPMLNQCAACGRPAPSRSGSGSGSEAGEESKSESAATEIAFRWDPDRGGIICRSCGQGGRPIRAVVREAMRRLSRVSLEQAEAERLPADVNRGCRDAILELIKVHITGPLHSVEFIAKLGGHT
jgi:DNA repair protein RecO (recombination protein O)